MTKLKGFVYTREADLVQCLDKMNNQRDKINVTVTVSQPSAYADKH